MPAGVERREGPAGRPPSTHGRGNEIDADGDAEPFAVAWRDWRLPMLQLATMLVDDRESAEDVVQEAFANLHRRWNAVQTPEAYLRTSVVNACRSVLRRRRLMRRHLIGTIERPAAGADVAALIAEEHREVVHALRRLPRRQREVIVLRYWQNLDDEQIATTLGVSASNVRATAARARQRIAAELEGSAS